MMEIVLSLEEDCFGVLLAAVQYTKLTDIVLTVNSYIVKIAYKSEMMQMKEIDKNDIKRAEDYLKGYCINGKLLRLERYEREYFGDKGACDFEGIGEVPLARARMYEVRHFINSLPNSDEKLFLYYRYIKGETVERCGELLGLSRSSAFRLKIRAVKIAAEELAKTDVQ